MEHEKKPVTLAAIAQELGVSTATVSLALQNKKGVSDNTRKLVCETAQRLGYVYNRSAARLRTQRSFTIGLVLPNLTNPFFTELTDSVEEEVEAAGLSLLLAKTSEDLSRQQKAFQSMLEYQVDGLLLCPASGTTLSDLKLLRDAQVPLVLFTRSLSGFQGDYVGANNEKGTFLACEYLLTKGHRKICFIGGKSHSPTRKERYKGYAEALKQKGILPLVEWDMPSETSLKGGYESIQKLLSLPDPPTATVCYNDVVAFGVILGLWAAQLVPGKEFAVVGFDNIADAALWSPPLTTIATPPVEVGKVGITLLLDRISSPTNPPREVILEPSLLVRESS
ncbi:MAG: LacI family DNA-binding transcriptional regulator [Spirochaetales bacterium]